MHSASRPPVRPVEADHYIWYNKMKRKILVKSRYIIFYLVHFPLYFKKYTFAWILGFWIGRGVGASHSVNITILIY